MQGGFVKCKFFVRGLSHPSNFGLWRLYDQSPGLQLNGSPLTNGGHPPRVFEDVLGIDA